MGGVGWVGGRGEGNKAASRTHTHTAIYQASTLSLATTSERRIAGLPDSCDRLGEPAVSSNAQPGRTPGATWTEEDQITEHCRARRVASCSATQRR
jgi:hypothetical protein